MVAIIINYKRKHLNYASGFRYQDNKDGVNLLVQSYIPIDLFTTFQIINKSRCTVHILC